LIMYMIFEPDFLIFVSYSYFPNLSNYF
jgi:hypothetical protein